ncbi:helix-turn-helix transcriptional regulator [Streptomyces sp. BPPL-273]|uniref:helix-turn-helix transcriptional regulator n=1 Tax=Streptomyces sp. BPPL-273 TaxID=2987533 RepID=UPI0024AF7C51|nr:helix-turn-helix transcriptional regulator [Streptomyces sp. BPPL-273]WHM32407.1 helix-turn-helix transcriptional regulator [Streptomyces sp. BPPL-273]
MDQDTKRLGSLLQAAREARRPKLTQPEAAELIGVGRTTVQNIEAGRFAKVNRTVRDYAALLGWHDGVADRVAEGGPAPSLGTGEGPEEAPPADTPPLPLPPAVDYELRNAETLDASVINLGPDEDDGHVIVVLQGRKGATPEEVARLAARYRKARRYLQQLASEDDGVADS